MAAALRGRRFGALLPGASCLECTCLRTSIATELEPATQAPNEGSSLTAASPAELESVLGAALDFAPRWNAWQSRIAGCCSLLKAWKAVVAVRRFARLHCILAALATRNTPLR